ncbi:hypothetical protein CVO91_07395 [Streptococcus suis]|uniref:mucin-binding protein n=4 Tax=Streptococcus suis TaxID=1307 RepID=UPI000C2877AD|nr:MucBP domain-containing protein [Streptococcus suis]ATZ03742.1 hypothetical protein CVO91_07395 [Streptococcus suis]
MHHSRRKSFDWYGLKQHFSIRKYHFGAASVLLGMSLAVGAGAQTAQAETTTATTGATTLASSTEVDSSTTTEASATEATPTTASTEVATAERTAPIEYTVEYQDESGKVVSSTVKSVETKTTDTIAIAIVTESAIVPEGYELAANEMATALTGVIEAGHSKVVFKVVKKAEEKAATSETTTTASTETATAKSTEGAATTIATVAETVKTPATVAEAKVVLEQVTSEAEVLANESERLVAASDKENTALKAAATATKLTATEATAVLNDSTATLEAVNEQIDAVRTNVEALALELRKFLGTDVIQVALTTTTASATVTQSTGNWTENAAVLNKEVAEQEATITPTDEDINSEYKLTEVADYKTFFVVDLSGNQDPTDTSIKSQGSFNYRFDKNWYMRFSTNSTLNDGSVLAELVDRSANHNVVETLTISPGESKQFNNIKTLAASSPIKENKSFQYKITNSEFNFSKDGQTSTLRNLDVYAGIGGTALSTIIYSPASTTIQGSVQNSFSSPIPTSGLDVTTKYVLEKTALKEEKLLATYTLSDANTGDTYTIAGAADFENYELVKTPQSNTGVVGPTYVKGSYVISGSWAASHNVVMVQTFSKEDGTSKFLNFALNVDHEDVKEYYKKTDVTAEDLKLEETIAIINDTSLSNEEKLTQIKALNAPYLLMFVSDDVAPRAGNTGPDFLTGKEVWTYTSNRLWIRNKYGAPYGDGKYGPVSNEITNTLFEQNGHPKGMFLPYEYILVNESGQYIDFDGNVHTGSNKTSFGGKRMFMFNEFSPSTGDVTYYYAEKGGVKVYYINEDGDEIATANLVIDHETSGTTFNVKSAEKSEITAADGTVYLFKAIDTNIKKATDPEERFTEKITSYEGAIKVDTVQELTLVYVKQQVGTVKFVDTTDNTVKFTENLSGKTGDEFGFDPAAKIKEFENLGYTVVNKDNYSSTGTFDNIDGNSQDFVFELTPKVSPITPDKPGKPGEPIDPNNPDGPTWPTDKGVDDVTRTISRTVTYVKAEGGEAAPGSSNSVTFERSGEINHVTGEVTWQAWTAKNGDATLEGNPLPVVTGYLAQSATNNGTKVELDSTVANVAATETTGNITEVVTYVKLGSWIPQPPTGTVEVPPTVYPNDPTDPTQPGTDVPTIPYIPGYVPVGPDGTTPVDPDDPTKGYKAPPVPGDPTTDTKIPYVKASQTGSVKFVDTTDGSVKFTETLNGQTGDEFGYDPAAKIKEFENLGYTVVNRDGYSSTGTFDNIDGNSQDFTYELTPKVSPITPDKPGVPGQPIDPNNPDGPTWPTDKGVDDVTRTISRTVTYVKAEGGEAAPGSSNSVTFERSGEINHVTGEVTWQAWTAKNGDATLEGNPLPVVTGYLAQSATNNGTKVELDSTVANVAATETTGNITEVVTYVKLGSWIPQPPTGTVEVPPTVYPNDPTDPTQPGTDVPTIPYIPGYVPVGPDGTTPVDPDDPTKGYKAPPVPGDPTTDTKIPYVKASQTGSVKFVDTTDGSVKFTETLNGQTGDEFGYDPAAKIKEFENLGYTVVNRDGYSSTGTFDNIDGNSQDFTYELTPKVSPITPDKPGVPGQPIDPNNPDGPTWPTDKGVDDVTRTISRTVTYVKAEGGEAAPGSSNSVTFERSGEINHVTGEVTWQAWTAKNGDATLEGNPLPVVTGYLAQSATNNGTKVELDSTVANVAATETTGNITEVVTYVKLGSWIPQPPTGTVEVPPTVYPNDPTDPTQPGTDVPTIPYIPGYVPVGPDGTTPVDPDDPTKGYKAPPVPGDPTTDTKIPYVKASQTGSVKFVDTTDGSVKFTETLNGQTGDEFGYDPAAKIKEFENLGYTVVNRDGYSSTGTFDNIDGNSQDFTYELTPKVSPITPDKPGVPGQPIDPNNPDGPTWPTDKGVDDVTRTISRTVTYVKAEGGEAAPGSSNSVTFERSGEINHVTGEVTWQAWTAKNGDATLEGNPLPVVTGYLAQSATNNGTKVELDSTVANVAATETTGNITEVVTYVKLGSWIPQPPTGTVEVPPTVYPNDPTDPTQPGTDVPTIPYIPGYVPVGPDGTTPVDPDDPTKGYKAPPVPGDPTTDTKIPYVKASQTGSVKFVDTTDGSVKFTETLNGQTGDEFGYDPAAKIKEFENLGYTVVNRDGYSSTGTFDNIDGNSQDFTYELTPKVSPITPDKPGVPGQPIDPNNPDGPTWPTDKGVDDVTRTISRTVTYVKAEGGEAAPGSSNSVTFERSGEINHVTGEVTWQAWTAKNGDATLEGNPLPVVTGYLAQSVRR